MKIKVKVKEKKHNEKPYPKLMTSKFSGNVYIMLSPGVGTKLYQSPSGVNEDIFVGTFKYDWKHPSDFIDFEGKLTIKS